jgi:hypothetical protein
MGDGMAGGRRALTASQVVALRGCVAAYQDVIAWQIPATLPTAGPAAMLYLMSLVLEAEANKDQEREHALGQRRSALEKLRQRLGRAPTAEEVEAHLQPAEPFDAGLRDFLRADIEKGSEAAAGMGGPAAD